MTEWFIPSLAESVPLFHFAASVDFLDERIVSDEIGVLVAEDRLLFQSFGERTCFFCRFLPLARVIC